jgi:hypothetical protein
LHLTWAVSQTQISINLCEPPKLRNMPWYTHRHTERQAPSPIVKTTPSTLPSERPAPPSPAASPDPVGDSAERERDAPAPPPPPVAVFFRWGLDLLLRRFVFLGFLATRACFGGN